MLAQRWNLPAEFVTLIAQHTHLQDLLANDAAQGAACVALASLLPSCSDPQWGERDEFIAAFTKITGQSDSELLELFAKVDEATAEFAPLLKLPNPKTPLVETI
jgi:HD-like signal output (HDOD) protein